MNPELSSSALHGVVERVLEDAAFVLTQPVHEPAPQDHLLQVKLPFSGLRLADMPALHGEFQLVGSRTFGQSLAANLLGIDESDERAVDGALDAMRELLNMVGGAIMEAMFLGSPAGKLGVPLCCAEPCSLGTVVARANCATCLVTEDGELIAVAIVLGDQTT